MHSFAPFSWDPFSKLNFCLKIAKNVANFMPNSANFVKISLEFVDFRADFDRNFTKSCRTSRINKNYQIFAENWQIVKICAI